MLGHTIPPFLRLPSAALALLGVLVFSARLEDPRPGAGPWNLTVQWGDVSWGGGASGQYTLAPGTTTYAITHQYLDDSPTGTPVDVLPVRVEVVDKDGGPGSAAASVTVANVVPVVGSLTLTDDGGAALGTDLVALTGLPVGVAAAFTDVGTLDTHTSAVTWGDGTSEAGDVVQGTGGRYAPCRSHVEPGG